jgi:hypothetical protein
MRSNSTGCITVPQTERISLIRNIQQVIITALHSKALDEHGANAAAYLLTISNDYIVPDDDAVMPKLVRQKQQKQKR